MHHFKAIGEFKFEFQSGNAQFRSKRIFFVPCDLEIWRMTLKNNRAPLLCCFKLCASFHSHHWIYTGVTVRKRSIRGQNRRFLSRVTLSFDRWPWKTIGHLFYDASNFVHHFMDISEFKLELQSGNAQFGSKPVISWWYDEGNIVIKVWRTDRQTDGQTDWTIHRAAWSQLKRLGWLLAKIKKEWGLRKLRVLTTPLGTFRLLQNGQ